jgi:hypothetical protein
MTFRIDRSCYSLLVLAVAATPPAPPAAAGCARHPPHAGRDNPAGGPALSGTKHYPATSAAGRWRSRADLRRRPRRRRPPRQRCSPPWPPNDVRATFFLIGRNAAALPALAARTAPRRPHASPTTPKAHPWTIDRLSADRPASPRSMQRRRLRSRKRHRIGSGRLSPLPALSRLCRNRRPCCSELSRRNTAVFGADLWAS